MRRGILRKGQAAGKSGWIFIRKHKKIDGKQKKKERSKRKGEGKYLESVPFWSFL